MYLSYFLFSILFTLDGSCHDSSQTSTCTMPKQTIFSCMIICILWKNLHRKHSACILVHPFSEYFVDQNLERVIMHGCIIVDTSSNDWTEAIRQLLDSPWGIYWNIHFTWHNSLHLLLKTIAVHLIILLCIHRAMFM